MCIIRVVNNLWDVLYSTMVPALVKHFYKRICFCLPSTFYFFSACCQRCLLSLWNLSKTIKLSLNIIIKVFYPFFCWGYKKWNLHNLIMGKLNIVVWEDSIIKQSIYSYFWYLGNCLFLKDLQFLTIYWTFWDR